MTPMTYSRLRTSSGRKSRIPRAGCVLGEGIRLARHHNLKSRRVSSEFLSFTPRFSEVTNRNTDTLQPFQRFSLKPLKRLVRTYQHQATSLKRGVNETCASGGLNLCNFPRISNVNLVKRSRRLHRR